MRFLIVSTFTAVALSTATLGFAGAAHGAPTGPDSAADTIRKLESEGRRVIVNRIGAAPLSQCAVTSVTAGQDITDRDPVGDTGSVERLRYRTVYVTVTC
ncbi:hypothetical protein BST23_06305 [Mycolicibacterium elephantis]|uniref:PASTA domain-containing protein n=1 Tax=Mycolicibacterium elephantis TaxID=81858 RepID=A0A1X0D4Z1_9MYCO|nr:hypothetical protein [Mycolicibacterium elephantis]ORA67435.1 hypothetical protein BST23_06305 [Mycolicibacterium elephantis]